MDALLFLTILVMFSCIPLKTKLMILLKACTFSSSSSKEEDKDISVSVVQVELVAASIYRVVNEHVRCTNLERGGHVFTRKEIIRTMTTLCSNEREIPLDTFASLCSNSEEIRSWNAALSKSRIDRNEHELYPFETTQTRTRHSVFELDISDGK